MLMNELLNKRAGSYYIHKRFGIESHRSSGDLYKIQALRPTTRRNSSDVQELLIRPATRALDTPRLNRTNGEARPNSHPRRPAARSCDLFSSPSA